MDNYDADLEASDTCVRSSLLSGVEYLFVRLLVHPEHYDTIRYDTRCYFNVRSKADMSQLNLPHALRVLNEYALYKS